MFHILSKVKSYINDYLYSARADTNQCCIISDILKQLEVNLGDYYAAIVKSSENVYKVSLIRSPNTCFVNKYFESS